MNKVCEYYNTVYDEDKRLNDECDNRHKTEREIKKRIILEYAHGSILDCSAGTGLYTLWLVQNGFNVTACDIVPEHVEQIKHKCKEYDVSVCVADALDLPYEEDSFDTILLAGALYHLPLNKQIIAIKEAYRVCRPNGFVLFDYLSAVHGIIQHELLDRNFLSQYKSNKSNEKIDEIFSYNTFSDMKAKIMEAGFDYIKVYGTDSITRFIRQDINKLDEKNCDEWIDFIYSISANENIIDLSEHCIIVGKKKEKNMSITHKAKALGLVKAQID